METNMVFGTVFGQVTMHSLYVVVDMRLLFEFLATQRTVEGFFPSVNQHMLFQSRPSKKEKNNRLLCLCRNFKYGNYVKKLF